MLGIPTQSFPHSNTKTRASARPVAVPKIRRLVFVTALFMIFMAATAAAQQVQDLQVNTPYQCPGGLIITVFQCQRQQGQEYCFVRAEQNGKFLTQVPKPRRKRRPSSNSARREFPSVHRISPNFPAPTE